MAALRPRDKTAAGRIFLAPGTSPAAAEVWVNIGWETEGDQVYPSYVPQLADACSADQYQGLMDALRRVLKGSSVNVPAYRVAALCFLCGGCCLWCIMNANAQTLRGEVADAVAEHCRAWPAAARLEAVATAGPGAADRAGLDQWGKPLVGAGPGGSQRPVWPPAGLNVVLTVPGDAMRGHWPGPGVVPLVPMQRPQPEPEPMLMGKPKALDAPAEGPVQGIPLAEASCASMAQQLRDLKELLEEGVLTQAEFDEQKAKLLSNAPSSSSSSCAV